MRHALNGFVVAAGILALTSCAQGAAHRGTEGAIIMPNAVDATHDGFSLNIFRNVVRGKVLDSFEALSRGDSSRALALMAPNVTYTFEGAHALGGTRVTKAGVEKWFGRLLRLLPGRFTLHSVEVAGWPWSATVYTVFEDVVTPAFGEPYKNHGVQIVDLEWGTAVRIHTYVDTATVERALCELAANGVTEAAAAPIEE